MKMSAARIRSIFKRHDSAHKEVFRFANNVCPVSGATAPVPVYTGKSPQAPPRQAFLDWHYQTAMKRELAKMGLL